MKTYEGNAEINKGNQGKYKDIEKVTGYLLVYGQATLNAPALTEEK